MTRRQLLALRPGDIIRRVRGNRRLRVVISPPVARQYAVGHVVISGVCLLKVGRSWTDPNRGAYYDWRDIERDYETTGARGCSVKFAAAVRNYRHR